MNTEKAATDDRFEHARYSDLVRETLDAIGVIQQRYRGLFPVGIGKIELKIEAKSDFVLHVKAEGEAHRSATAHPFLNESGKYAANFEAVIQPASLVTPDSPIEATKDDQAKLSEGVTLEGAAKKFERACGGKESDYANNCAHYLSDAFIDAGFSELAKAHSCVTHRCGSPECTSGERRPTRAKDMRCWFRTKDSRPVSSISRGTGFYAVYQERQSDGQGHVAIIDSGTWKYYGTGWFEQGQPAPDDWKHQYFKW